MAILIDPPSWPARGRLWSHLVSDTSWEELHTFAAAHGIPRRGFERDHYDVPAEVYDDLVAAGAEPVSAHEIVRRLHQGGTRRRKAEAMAHRPAGRVLLRPPRLRPGDVVAVVATAGAVDPDRLDAGARRLEDAGLRVRFEPHVLDRHHDLGYLAATDEERAADFTRAWLDPEVAGIVVARGGYGTERMLNLLDWRRLAEADPTMMVGFSDVTALHQAVAQHLGLVTILGHVATSLGAATPNSTEALRRLLMDPESVIDVFADQRDAGQPITAVSPGRSAGVLLGGNLALLAAEVGTPTSRVARGGIVVLEDVDEDPYRLDRMVTQLLRSGWFDEVRGIVLGNFTRCGGEGEAEAMLVERLRPLGVPLVTGFDAGHTDTQLPVPLGVWATLDAGSPDPSLRISW